MKKIFLLVSFIGLMGLSFAKADSPSENSGKNKMTHNKVVRKTGKAISHIYYDGTHNFLTKFLNINDGNQKYKNQDDIK